MSIQPGDDEDDARTKGTAQPPQTEHNEPLPLCDLLEAEPEGDGEGDTDEEVAQASNHRGQAGHQTPVLEPILLALVCRQREGCWLLWGFATERLHRLTLI